MFGANVKQASYRGSYPIKLRHMVEKNSTVDHLLHLKRITLKRYSLVTLKPINKTTIALFK
jgi:hypothetical protein